jgi:hypothetical protein
MFGLVFRSFSNGSRCRGPCGFRVVFAWFYFSEAAEREDAKPELGPDGAVAAARGPLQVGRILDRQKRARRTAHVHKWNSALACRRHSSAFGGWRH